MIYRFVFYIYFQSVKKTGRVMISHEAPLTSGFGSEIAATIQVFFRIFIIVIQLNYTFETLYIILFEFLFVERVFFAPRSTY